MGLTDWDMNTYRCPARIITQESVFDLLGCEYVQTYY